MNKINNFQPRAFQAQFLQMKASKQTGFTLIEIMVVVIIIGLLSAVILPNVLGQRDKAAKIKAEADISSISNQLQLYRLDNFTYPSTSEGIQALVTNPGKSTWTQYLTSLPKDPWGNQYQYAFPGSNNPNSFDLWSTGADSAAGGEGQAADIGNWNIEQ